MFCRCLYKKNDSSGQMIFSKGATIVVVVVVIFVIVAVVVGVVVAVIVNAVVVIITGTFASVQFRPYRILPIRG